jgi:aliphatic nitrilase
MEEREMADSCLPIKVAAVQASPVYLDREGTIEKACSLIREAGETGAKIVAFPECFVSGYPHYYVSVLSNPFLEEKKNFKKLFKSSLEVPSPETEGLCEAARRSNTYVVIGINERTSSSMGTLYNSQLFIDNKG